MPRRTFDPLACIPAPEIVREKLMARPLDADVERAALVERAMAYLDEAQSAPAPAPMLVDV